MGSLVIRFATVLLALGLSLVGARAAEPGRAVTEQGEIRLIAATTAIGESEHIQIGLLFRPKAGWKILWRSPGDAGDPPSIGWKGSGNLTDTIMSWPAPQRIRVGGTETLGYEGEVVLPIVAVPTDIHQPLSLKASVDYQICAETCLPGHVDLALDLPSGKADASPFAHLIGRFLARLPGNGVPQGIFIKSVEATERDALKVVVEANPPLAAPDLFVERSDGMQFSRPKVIREKEGRHVIFVAKPLAGTGEGGLNARPVTLTVIDGERAMEGVADALPARPGGRLVHLLAILGSALLGGLIANGMPSAAPVLAMKFLSAGDSSEPASIRSEFLALASGIAASCILLALVMLIAKTSGGWVGWGIQFQQPVYLTAMALVLGLFAVHLADFSDSARKSPALGGASGWAVPVAQGAFAVLLASPCPEPLLGKVLGYALARGPLEILSVFAALGLGMASPYLAVAAWPGLVRPLAAPWPRRVRRGLSLPLAATAVWLLLVLASITQNTTAFLIGGLTAAGLACLAIGARLPSALRLGGSGVLAVAALAVAVLAPPSLRPEAAAEARFGKLWQPLDNERIGELVTEGKVVFVDVTADWCLTCRINQNRVLYRDPVASALKAPGVVAMRADWTGPDDDVAAFLSAFGHYNLPFDIVYGPGAPDGVVLPERLDAESLKDALDTAGTAKP